jgi:hypothetical protein
MIISSRVGSPADLIGNLTEKLMDGRYSSDFYRPLTSLSFAFDHALWGLNAFGYQLTNALLLAASAWALWFLLRRLLGPRAWFGTLLGLSVFVLSSLQFEVLPVPPRRPELLCCLFMALALALQLSPRALRAQRPPLWPAFLTLLAIASKESGFVLPVLTALVVGLYSEHPTLRERLRHVGLTLVPHVAVVLLMIVIRLLLLGGMGGHRSISLGEVFSSAPQALHVVASGLLLPQPAMSASVLGRLLLAGLLLALTVTLIWAALRARSGGGPRTLPRGSKASIVALTWIGLLGVIYSAAGLIGPWYLLLPLAGWALLTGALAERLLDLTDENERPLAWLAIASVTLLVSLLVWQSSYSPVFRRYGEWERATSVSDSFLSETRSIIEAAADGTVVEAPPLPQWVSNRGQGHAVRGAAVLADYSVQAWADLIFPRRNVRVVQAGPDIRPPDPDEVVLLITRRLEG